MYLYKKSRQQTISWRIDRGRGYLAAYQDVRIRKFRIRLIDLKKFDNETINIKVHR